MDDLDSFLDTGTPEPITEDAPQPETIGQPRDDGGRFAPKETGVEPQETAEQVPPTTDKLPQEEYKATKAEREKRQAAEARAASLEAQLQSLQQPKEAPPSIWDDDQAALAHTRDDAVSIAVQQATFNARLDMSEMMTRQANADFEDMKAKFLSMADMNPAIRQQALADPHPWNKAYQIAKNAAKMEALGAVDVSELEAKLREQIRAEMAQQPAANLPTSLAGVQSARTSSVTPAAFSFDDIFRR